MAAIYLKHSVHGAKVACSVHEAEIDKKQGWVEFDPKIPTEVIAEILSDLVEENPSEVVAEATPQVAPRRRGRPSLDELL